MMTSWGAANRARLLSRFNHNFSPHCWRRMSEQMSRDGAGVHPRRGSIAQDRRRIGWRPGKCSDSLGQLGETSRGPVRGGKTPRTSCRGRDSDGTLARPCTTAASGETNAGQRSGTIGGGWAGEQQALSGLQAPAIWLFSARCGPRLIRGPTPGKYI